MLYELLVAKPYGDIDPFDYLVGKLRPNWRVQVKTCGNLSRHGTYHVSIARRTGRSRRQVPYTPEEVDFIAIYLVPEDTWYIVPIEVIDGRMALTIHAHDHPKIGPWMPFREAWHLLAQTGERTVLPQPEPNAPTPRRAAGTGEGKGRPTRSNSPPEGYLSTPIKNGAPEAAPPNADS